MLQAGYIGILQAIPKYDITHNAKATFNTYAYLFVKAAIQRDIDYGSSLIHVPQQKRSQVKVGIASLDAKEEWMLGTALADTQVELSTRLGEFHGFLAKCLDPDSMDYEFVCRRYGLGGRPAQTYTAIGQEFDMSKQRV